MGNEGSVPINSSNVVSSIASFRIGTLLMGRGGGGMTRLYISGNGGTVGNGDDLINSSNVVSSSASFRIGTLLMG